MESPRGKRATIPPRDLSFVASVRRHPVPVTLRDGAGGVYDAVNAIEGGYHRTFGVPRAADASTEAAVATAAHHVLDGLGFAPYPPLPQAVGDGSTALTPTRWPRSLTGPAEDRRHCRWGRRRGTCSQTRADDGRYVPFSFTVGTNPGEWRPTPPASSTTRSPG